MKIRFFPLYPRLIGDCEFREQPIVMRRRVNRIRRLPPALARLSISAAQRGPDRHVRIRVRDVEGNDAVVGGALLVLLSDALAVVGFHRKYQIGAGDKLLRERSWGIRICASGQHIEARPVLEQVFGCRASKFVGGADEQYEHIHSLVESLVDQNPPN